MGIIASYIVKVHVHGFEGGPEEATGDEIGEQVPSNDQISAAVVIGVKDQTGFDATVSQIDRVDD